MTVTTEPIESEVIPEVEVEVEAIPSDMGIQENTVVIEATIVPEPKKNPLHLLRRIARAAARFVRALVSAVHTSARNLSTAARTTVRYFRTLHTARTYQPRHQAIRTWYGVQRSTAQRNAQRAQASKEGELSCLPDEFVGWMVVFIEKLREEDRILHPPAQGRHFICS